MSPCDSNKKSPGWERRHETLLRLHSNPNPPMQSKIHPCQKCHTETRNLHAFTAAVPDGDIYANTAEPRIMVHDQK